MTREAVFECTYGSGAARRTTLVRAWDEREAIEAFALELRAEGIRRGRGGKIGVHARRPAVAPAGLRRRPRDAGHSTPSRHPISILDR